MADSKIVSSQDVQTTSLFETNMVHKQSFSVLYAKDKNGKIKKWCADVFINKKLSNDQSTQKIVYGYIDGKLQISYRDYNEGKNIGKKNETTPLMQCIAETRRKWLDKKEKEGYTETIPDEQPETSHIILPMLAQTYDPLSVSAKKHTITFPCFVQPKLDGLRCVTYVMETCAEQTGVVESKIIHQSRTGASFEGLMHITESVSYYLKMNPNIVLDGELYTDEMPFEELVGLIKKKKIDADDMLRLRMVKYHIYDIYDKNIIQKPYSDRLRDCVVAVNACGVGGSVGGGDDRQVQLVRTIEVRDISEFRSWFAVFIEEGYEGIMLRNKTGIYRLNYRSNDLQKYKEFVEDEYKIVGYTQAEGRDKGTVLWICITSDGKSFTVRPRGTVQMRRKWYQEGDKYIGKNLTVIYQELTEEGKPRFPVGKAVRDGY
jgi:DNA ligase-1